MSEHGIPAAHVEDVDYAAIARFNPEAAQEIRRIGDLLGLGKETVEEFRRLIELLHETGEAAKAEHLLRRNLDLESKVDRLLYSRLFGTLKPDEFEDAIEAFRIQFDGELEVIRDNDFLSRTYLMKPRRQRNDGFRLMSQLCEVRISYVERNTVEADVVLYDPARDVFAADECLLLFWIGGVWEMVDPLKH
jgi:hypothetical protein